MWIEAVPVTAESVAQLVRFNEAIDQVLAEGVAKFTERLDYDAQLFTASISHDLANPVNAVKMSADWLSRSRNLTDAERESFTALNDAYVKKFGFPFIIAVRDNTKASILKAFETRLENSREAEFETACKQVERIARLRLNDLLPQ